MSQHSSTAVAIPGIGRAPTDEEIERIRKGGRSVVAHREEINRLAQQIEGMEWGSGKDVVKGTMFSPATRRAFAEFCKITKANPLHHVYVLGGKPYLNGDYWSDRINADPYFHHFEQRDLSPSVDKALRERAKRHGQIAGQLEGEEAAERRARAIDLEEEADDIALARAQWSPPDGVRVVIETTIYRFMNQAPLDAIERGEVPDFERYLIEVSECNWAGGKGRDPVGDAHPALTARTRSLRRAAIRAFPAWMQGYEAQMKKAESIIDAEFEIIREDNNAERESLPVEGEPQAARTGSGEPGAANANGAQPLPDANGAALESAGDDDFDADDARKRYFATLRDAGVEDRKAWQVENGLPASTKAWGEAEYERALEILVKPTKEKFRIGCRMAGLEEDAVAQEILDREPDTLRDYQELLRHVNRLVDQEDDEQTEAAL